MGIEQDNSVETLKQDLFEYVRLQLGDQIIDIETHEACEFFKLGDRRPFYPH